MPYSFFIDQMLYDVKSAVFWLYSSLHKLNDDGKKGGTGMGLR